MSGRTAQVEVIALWRQPMMRQLVLISLLGFSSFCLTLASAPSWALAGGVPRAAAGLPTTVLLASTVLSQAAVPTLVARLGIGRTLAAGLVALAVPAPFYALSHDLRWLLPLAAVRGIGFAVLTVVGATLTARVAPPGRHGESVGLYGLAIAVPNLVAIPAGVALTQAGHFGWVAALAAAPLLGVPLALALVRSVDAVAPGLLAGEDGEVSHARAVRAALPPSVVLLAVTLAGGGLMTFLPIQRPSGTVATVALLVFGATAALTRWRAGLLADRYGSRLLLPASLLVAVVGMVVLAAALHLGSAADSLVVVGGALFGAGYGSVQNLTLIIAFARSGPSRTTTASAVWNAAFDAGTGIGAGTVGAVAATGIGVPAALGLTAVLIGLSLPLALHHPQISPTH